MSGAGGVGVGVAVAVGVGVGVGLGVGVGVAVGVGIGVAVGAGVGLGVGVGVAVGVGVGRLTGAVGVGRGRPTGISAGSGAGVEATTVMRSIGTRITDGELPLQAIDRSKAGPARAVANAQDRARANARAAGAGWQRFMRRSRCAALRRRAPFAPTRALAQAHELLRREKPPHHGALPQRDGVGLELAEPARLETE